VSRVAGDLVQSEDRFITVADSVNIQSIRS